MLPDCNFLSYIFAIYNCNMETTSKEKAIRLAVFSVCAIFIANFASPTYLGMANAQRNKTLVQPQEVHATQGVQGTMQNTTNMNIILVHGID